MLLYKMINQKKAQIGTTLTWFVAFLIIFFIMTLFVTVTIVSSVKKNAPLIGTGKDEISLGEYNPDIFNSQKNLIKVLNYEIIHNNKMKISQLIKDWSMSKDEGAKIQIKDEVEKVLKKILKSETCYVFHIEYGLEEFKKNQEELKKQTKDPRAFQGISEVIEAKTIEFDNLLHLDDQRVSGYLEGIKNDFLDKAYEINLFFNNGKIKIKLFTGGNAKC